MKNDQLITALIGILLCILLILGAVIFISFRPQKPIEPFSTFSLTPSPSLSPGTEPEVASYKIYLNDSFYFSLAMPEEWFVQDFSKAHPQGGSIVAFSPEKLPCESCTYFRNGFYSIHIYNKTSFPEQYAAFQQKMAAVGKHKDYRAVQIGGRDGVFSPDSVAVEHQGWVYEFRLDKDIGKKNIAESKILVKALTTFQFTGLEFGK